VIVDTGQFLALREQVSGHEAQIADTSSKFDSVMNLMRMCLREVGIDPDNPSGGPGPRGRHLRLVKGDRR
jgi:hypothetical protein